MIFFRWEGDTKGRAHPEFLIMSLIFPVIQVTLIAVVVIYYFRVISE